MMKRETWPSPQQATQNISFISSFYVMLNLAASFKFLMHHESAPLIRLGYVLCLRWQLVVKTVVKYANMKPWSLPCSNGFSGFTLIRSKHRIYWTTMIWNNKCSLSLDLVFSNSSNSSSSIRVETCSSCGALAAASITIKVFKPHTALLCGILGPLKDSWNPTVMNKPSAGQRLPAAAWTFPVTSIICWGGPPGAEGGCSHSRGSQVWSAGFYICFFPLSDSDQCDSNERNEAETTREGEKKGRMQGRYGNKTTTREAWRWWGRGCEDDEQGGVRWRLPSSEGGLRDTKSRKSQGAGPSSFHPPPNPTPPFCTPISPNCFSAGLIKIPRQPVM